jgi:hypothetical protein
MSINNDNYDNDLVLDGDIPAVSSPLAVGRASAKSYFLEKDQCMKILVVMCRGIIDKDGKPLLDPTEHPWNKVKPVSTIKPLASDYRIEIEMRICSSYPPMSSPPRPKAWKLERILNWLDKNPITAIEDVEYLTKVVSFKKVNSIQALENSQSREITIGQGGMDRAVSLPAFDSLFGRKRQH